MKTRLLAVIMAVGMLFGLFSPMAGAEESVAPETNETQLITESTAENLPASPLELPSGSARMQAGVIPLGEISGYQFMYGHALLREVSEQSAGIFVITLSQGQIDLNQAPIRSGSQYSIELNAKYVSLDGSNHFISYADQIVLSGEEWLVKEEWPISADAVQVNADLSAFEEYSNPTLRLQPAGMITYSMLLGQDAHGQGQFTLLVKPGLADIQFFGKKNNTGYVIRKPISIQQATSIAIEEADLTSAIPIALPSESGKLQIEGIELSGVNQLRLSKGFYQISIEQEEGSSTLFWSQQLEVSAAKSLDFGAPELVFNSLYVREDRISTSISIKRGDFNLVHDYGPSPGTGPSVLFTIKNGRGETVKQFSGSFWGTSEEIAPVLKPGQYSIEASYSYSNEAAPIKGAQTFLIRYADEPNTNGITIEAEDDAGNPLRDAQVFLYENTFFNANDPEPATGVYFPSLKYQADATSQGELFIPSGYLLAGKDYEVVVTGRSSGGQSGGVVYHQSVDSAQTELKLTRNSLKQLNYQAELAQPGSYLHMFIRQGQYNLTWPVSIPFDNQQRASVFVQTDETVLASAYLYPAGDVGYYLQSERLGTASGETIDLMDELVKVTAPRGYEDSRVSVNGGLPKPSYYVTKGQSVQTEYSVLKDGYRYSFHKTLNSLTNQRLSFQRALRGDTSQQLLAGVSGQRVLQAFMDEDSNRLVGVSHEPQGLSNEGFASPVMSFEVQETDGKSLMTVENTGEGIVYRELSRSEASLGLNFIGGVSSPLLEYQLYDGQNLPVGNRLITEQLPPFEWSASVEPGDYVLKLVQQHFPEEVVQLSGAIAVQVLPGEPNNQRVIPIAFPAGYDFDTQNYWNNVEIRTHAAGETQFLGAAISHEGKLIIEDTDAIEPTAEYVILMAIRLKEVATGRPNRIYYHQVRMTGSELINLNSVPVASDLVSVAPSFAEMPFAVWNINLFYLMPVAGYSTPFQIYSAYPQEIQLLTSPGEFVAQLSGYDIAVSGFNIYKRLSVHPSTGKVTVSELNMHQVQLKDRYPFLSFSISHAEYLSWGGVGYSLDDKRMLNQLFLSEGLQTIVLVTYETPPRETPWLYTWETLEPINVQGDRVIDFGGEIDAAKSSLKLEQGTVNGNTRLNVMVELVNGEMKLISVSNIVNGSTYYPAGKVTIKNSQNQTLYTDENMAWNGGTLIEKQLAAGTYTLIFSLPVGPNKEIRLTKAFVVGNEEDSVPPTAPAGLSAASITDKSMTLSWMPSSDNVGVVGYRIYSGNVLVSSTTGATSTSVTGLAADTTYAFTVKAIDAKGNLSPASSVLSVKTTLPAVGGLGGGGGGGGPAQDTDTLTVLKKDIPAAANGIVKIDATDHQTVILPSGLTSLLGGNRLEVKLGQAVVTVPPEVVEQLSSLVEPKRLSAMNIVLSAVELSEANVPSVTEGSNEGIRSAGPVYELQLVLKAQDGTTVKLEQFSTPVSLRFKVDARVDRRLTGIYFISDEGRLTYAGGKWEGDELVASVPHFSKYGVFEIKKQFSDIGDKHWALAVIQELAAKQIINGVADKTFAPENNVTRAEFAVMIAKALRLTSQTSMNFDDVPSQAWYAGGVAAVYERGIIQGVGGSSFAPLQQITREEMAVMVSKALRSAGLTAESGEHPVFKDGKQISGWAQEAVMEAASNGLLKGRSGSLFSPKTQATRAEAVQVISNLLNKIAQ
ncbi:S-layer homology domain-containing protein [Cohnella boryungensis]|uniref:S-layer homology domain-containing protein n=1 Tax=Cohnella boryungensis TaxID=768479 RepID=A0ABV8S892_9BACL